MNGGDAGASRTITVRTGTIDDMTTTSGETVIAIDTATAMMVHVVGAVTAVGVAVGRTTTSNEPPV